MTRLPRCFQNNSVHGRVFNTVKDIFQAFVYSLESHPTVTIKFLYESPLTLTSLSPFLKRTQRRSWVRIMFIRLLYRLNTGGVCTLIALHHGRKTKSESLASCCGRVNISGGSKIARRNVECNGDSKSVAIPSKVKKCWQACPTPVIPP